MDAVFYWDMTYAEIIATIEAYNKRKQADLKEKAVFAYKQANLIAAFVGASFSSNASPPSIHEAFPDLFEAPKLQFQQQPWQIMKERIEAYAAAKRKRGEMVNGDDD